MAYRTLSLSRLSRKAQFFVLSAFAIVTILYFVSRWTEPYTIIDTSSMILSEEPFIFNDIKEKAVQTVKTSKDCEDLSYSLEEYKNFVSEFVSRKNLKIVFNYVIAQPCDSSILTTSFYLSLSSPTVFLNSSFTARK